jgi:hypothetical protein
MSEVSYLKNDPNPANKESQWPSNADKDEEPDDGEAEVAAAHGVDDESVAVGMVVCNKYIPRTMARLSNFLTVASRMPMRRAGPNVVTNAVSFHGLIASGTFNSSKKEGDKLVID